MSRQINQPVASIKLTNVATVRYVVKGKRFEVACYRNKVLDYRRGLETDLSEVLQTSNIHVFTNVAKGQFAAASDLQEAFGSDATQEEIAIQILRNGKSLQISEEERTQLYESTLTKIATWIASNCIHSVTGKPYMATQIKQALTQPPTAPSTSKQKHEQKKKQGKKTQQSQQSFTVQPHKPIKQQYLAALKYLQSNDILPIQRAAMELQWQYPIDQQEQVTAAVTELQIAPPPQRQQQAQTNNDDTETLILIVDPAMYRPLQQATDKVPGSRLEIVRQQVFQAVPGTTGKKTNEQITDGSDDSGEAPASQPKSATKNGSSSSSDSGSSGSESDGEAIVATTRKNQRKAKKKQQKKAQRRQQRAKQEQESSSSESNGNEEEEEDAALIKENKNETPATISPANAATATDASTVNQPKVSVWTCNTCVGSVFATQTEHRAHFRSDWHRYNQKLKLQGATPISYQEFQQCDAETFFTTALAN